MVTVVQGKVCAKNHPDRLSRLATIHQRYRRTDGRTDRQTDFLWHRPDLTVGQSTSKSENFFSGRHYRCRQALRFASVVAAALNTSESRHFCRCDLAANKVIKSERYIKIEYAYCFHNYSDYVYQKLSKLVHVTRS